MEDMFEESIQEELPPEKIFLNQEEQTTLADVKQGEKLLEELTAGKRWAFEVSGKEAMPETADKEGAEKKREDIPKSN